MAAGDLLCVPRHPDTLWVLQESPCRDDERPAPEALAAASFLREIERRWSMQDYLADSASIDRVEASEHFFAHFRDARPGTGPAINRVIGCLTSDR